MSVKKDTIFQFVCFITNLEPDDFAPKWEHYAKKLTPKKMEPVLQRQVNGKKNRFRYISRHEWPERDFQFSFMDERRSEHFPEHNVKVVQTGGYIPLHTEKNHTEKNGEVKVIAFISHNETDIEFYRHLHVSHQMNIYQAFYESCSYAYVMEFFVHPKDADALMLQLKDRSGTESGVYIECLVPQV